MPRSPKLVAQPLAAWERDGLVAALRKAGLPTEDVTEPGPLFWRFVTADDVPVGFGGLEIHGGDAVLRSVVTLPPVRQRGIGRAIVLALEAESALHGATAIWLVASAHAKFFAALGYAPCDAADVPQPLRRSAPFSSAGADAPVMRKRL